MRRSLVACMVSFIVAAFFVAVAGPPGEVRAGENVDGIAELSWSADSVRSDLAEFPGSLVELYVRLEGVTEIRGCEFVLFWSQAGEEEPGVTISSVSHPSGEDCSWLMRGTQVVIPIQRFHRGVRVAFASSLPNDVCTEGNIAKIILDMSEARKEPMRFAFAFLKVTDDQARPDYLFPKGATILGGEGAPDPLEHYRGDILVQKILPPAGATGGSEVKLVGKGFMKGTKVLFDGKEAPEVRVLGGDSLRAVTPPHEAGSVDVKVVLPTGYSRLLRNYYSYSDLPAPRISGIDPPRGSSAGGEKLVITGENFVEGVMVLIGGAPCSDIRLVSSTRIEASSGSWKGDPGTYDVKVINPDRQYDTLRHGFTYLRLEK